MYKMIIQNSSKIKKYNLRKQANYPTKVFNVSYCEDIKECPKIHIINSVSTDFEHGWNNLLKKFAFIEKHILFPNLKGFFYEEMN